MGVELGLEPQEYMFNVLLVPLIVLSRDMAKFLGNHKLRPYVLFPALNVQTDQGWGLPLGVVGVEVELVHIHGCQSGWPQCLHGSLCLHFLLDV